MVTTRVDAAAIGLSGLCIVHCLALPLMALLLPVAGHVSHSELVHQVFVFIAIPLALFALVNSRAGLDRIIFLAMVTFGLGLLVAGAFVETLHDYKTPLTLGGALLLGGAHGFRWMRQYRVVAG